MSYIVAGKDRLDCQMAMEKLYRLFHIEKLLICGGGMVDWSFLRAGMVDELSLFLAPVSDGSQGTASLFSRMPGEGKRTAGGICAERHGKSGRGRTAPEVSGEKCPEILTRPSRISSGRPLCAGRKRAPGDMQRSSVMCISPGLILFISFRSRIRSEESVPRHPVPGFFRTVSYPWRLPPVPDPSGCGGLPPRGWERPEDPRRRT